MRKLLVLSVLVALWFSIIPPAFAANTTLVPCNDSPAFQQRREKAPNTYYFDEPMEAYASLELCGADGLPHLPLDRVDRAIDVLIPFTLFFYVAGFIGWSGRSYLQAANRAANPEEKEIFIDLALAIQSLIQGLLWPLLALKELLSGQLTANDAEISVSPR